MKNEDDQYSLAGMGESNDPEGLLVPKKSRYKPRGRTTGDYISTYGDTGYAEFLMNVARIGREVRAQGTTAEAMADGLMRYAHMCEENGKPMTYLAAYMAMGIDRRIAYDILHDRKFKNDPKKKAVVSDARMMCAVTLESMMVSNTVHPVTGIFWQKVHEGFSEDAEANAMLSESRDADSDYAENLIDKYTDLPD